MQHPVKCYVCGGQQRRATELIWSKLAADWQLAPDEVAYINRQQAACCVDCGANLRSNALARAIGIAVGVTDDPLCALVARDELRDRAILEINGAGTLGLYLQALPHHTLLHYPAIDMMAIDAPDASFDLVLHSDTLEHVEHPVRALAECRRVLKPNGSCCFTVPIIVGRMSRSRAGLGPSYHGDPSTRSPDLLVHWEFGADIWSFVMRAGFAQVEIVTVEHPAAQALIAR